MEVLHGHPQFALAVSRFVISRMSTWPGTQAVLFYPPFTRIGSDVPDASARPDDLLMVNPVPAKGSQLMKELARQLPERRFTLVEGWWDMSAYCSDLANVRYVRRTYEIDALYLSHRLLLVPSVIEDAFPRVIIEAGLAGLPTIGSDRGGIGEAVEDGGLVVANADATSWASAIRSLEGSAWTDRAERARERSVRLVRDCVKELAAAGVIATI